jgi:hypothetical protein
VSEQQIKEFLEEATIMYNMRPHEVRLSLPYLFVSLSLTAFLSFFLTFFCEECGSIPWSVHKSSLHCHVSELVFFFFESSLKQVIHQTHRELCEGSLLAILRDKSKELDMKQKIEYANDIAKGVNSSFLLFFFPLCFHQLK